MSYKCIFIMFLGTLIKFIVYSVKVLLETSSKILMQFSFLRLSFTKYVTFKNVT